MKKLVFLRATALATVLAAVLVPVSGIAKAWAQSDSADSVVPSYPDADALAAEMRILGANPKDEAALIRAGELTLKIGDIDAAAAFFARADRINPSNARTKAGAARALLHMERPGEALRLFNEADALGVDRAAIASERGLAFDLIGEQERAQREYRLALTRGPDGETIRRYALSLGIVGKREQAFQQIDGLLRQSDRAAWRVRAFVLAMSGDVAGAETIAASMLPGTMASGLLPFFRVLATLGPVDRAFAVHFGEVRPTAQRVADARLIPVLPPLAPEPNQVPPTALAAAAPPPAARVSERRRDRGRDRNRGRGQPVQVAAVVPPPLPLPPSFPPPPDERQQVAESLVAVPATPARNTSGSVGLPGSQPSAGSVLAAAATRQPGAPPAASPVTMPDPNSTAGRVLAEVRARQAREAAARPPVAATATARPANPPAVSSAPDTSTGPVQLALTELPPPSGRLGPVQPASMPIASPQRNAAEETVRPVTSPAAPPRGPAPGPVQLAMTELPPPNAKLGAIRIAPSPVAPQEGPTAAPAAAEARPTDPAGDSILARIVATIGVPAEELDVEPIRPPVTTAPAPAQASVTTPVLTPPTLPANPGAAQSKTSDPVQAELDRKAAAKAAAAKLAADKLAAEKKAAAKKLADENAAKAKALKAEPERIWVQVAGGSSVRDLPREWKRVADKAPAAFKGRTAYTTPLRFTNRVLAGPFKSEDAAQSFVNQIAKAGLTGFVFVSEAGQKIDKLPAK